MLSPQRKPALLALAALLPLSALAQSGANTGLTGRVLDPSRAAVPAAAVAILNPATGFERSVQTDDAGAFEARYLAVGEYTVTVKAEGFRVIAREGVQVTTGEVATLTFELELGQDATEVTVIADAEMVNRSSAAIVREIDSRELERLPTSSRNFTQLLLIEPGVDADLSNLLSNNNANASPAVNGMRTTSNSFSFNGADATNLLCCNSRINLDRGTLAEGAGSLSRNIAPAPETLAEVKLSTSLYDVSTGRNGGGAFQLVSKSGTNDLHGAAYYYNQNDALMSNDFFFERAGIEKQKLSRHEGGFTVGGPIVKNRTFFFGSYQRTDAKTAYVNEASNTVRMPQALTDDRSAAGLAAFAEALGANPAALNPISVRLLQTQYEDGAYMIPSGAGGRNCEEDDEAVSCQVTSVLPATYEQDQFSANLNHNFTNNQLSGKFFFANQPSRDPFSNDTAISRFEEEENTRQRVFSLSDTHIFSPKIINEAVAGIFFNRNDTVPVVFFTNSEFGIDNPRASERADLASFVIEPEDVGSDFTFGTPENLIDDKQITTTLSDTLSIQSGRHFFKLGGMYRNHRLDGDYQETRNLQFGLESWAHFLTVGEPDGDDEGEQIAESSISYGETFRQFRMSDFALFLADDWKVNPKLTLNLGLRWEYFGWPAEKRGLISNYDLERARRTGGIADGYIFASNFDSSFLEGADQVTRAATKSTIASDTNNFAPRFGFAYSPLSNRGLVLRGGYGFFYDRPTGGFINALRRSPPFFREREINDTDDWNTIPDDAPTFPLPDFVVDFDDGEPFLSTMQEPGEEFEALEAHFIDPSLKIPYVQQWNFTLQVPLGGNMVGDIGYVGTKATRLLQAVNLNAPVSVADVGGFLARPGVPSGGFASDYFEIVDDEYVPTPEPACDVFDDFEECTVAAELRTPILGFDEDEGLNSVTSDSNSSYHALQASLQRRYSAGLSYNVNYTFSKAIDYFSDEGQYQVQHDQRRLFLNRAVSDFDRKHRLILSFSYDLPFKGSSFAEGWSVSGIGTVQSGRPFSIIDSPDFSGFLYAPTTPRPNLAEGSTYDDLVLDGSARDRVDKYFRTDLVESSGPGFGDMGRNILRAPWQRRLDLSFLKVTRLTERASLEIRLEGYNITNTPSFRAPQANLDEGDFGELTESLGGPRVFQIGAKLRF